MVATSHHTGRFTKVRRLSKAHAPHCRVIEMKRLGRDTAARKGKHGGRSAVVTEDMLHTVLRRRVNGETVEQARIEHAQRTGADLPAIVRPRPARVLDPIDAELAPKNNA